jgi:hypothetical protein
LTLVSWSCTLLNPHCSFKTCCKKNKSEWSLCFQFLFIVHEAQNQV